MSGNGISKIVITVYLFVGQDGKENTMAFRSRRHERKPKEAIDEITKIVKVSIWIDSIRIIACSPNIFRTTGVK